MDTNEMNEEQRKYYESFIEHLSKFNNTKETIGEYHHGCLRGELVYLLGVLNPKVQKRVQRRDDRWKTEMWLEDCEERDKLRFKFSKKERNRLGPKVFEGKFVISEEEFVKKYGK